MNDNAAHVLIISWASIKIKEIDMSNELMSLAEQYRDCNFLLPATSQTQLNPFYKLKVEVVPVDLGENSGDVFKVGSTRMKDQYGKDIYVDVYSLSKPLLNKMAMAAGIQFNPRETFGERVDKYTYRAHAQGAIRKADGTARTESDQKEICLLDEEDKYRTEFEEKAKNGIEDYRQANAAAEKFHGHWEDVFDQNGQPKKLYGKPVRKFVIDEADRSEYVEKSVRVNMALLRKTWAEKAMTGAKLRVIRALLGTKGTYTLEELRRNFAIPSVVFSPDYNDPIVRQAMFTQAAGSMTNMFGIPAAPVQKINFETEASAYDTEPDMSDPAYISDRQQNEAEYYQQPEEAEYIPAPEPEPEPVRQAPPPQTQRAATSPPQRRQAPAQQQAQSGYTCADCGREIKQNVYEFSMKVFKRALCMDCQKKARANK